MSKLNSLAQTIVIAFTIIIAIVISPVLVVIASVHSLRDLRKGGIEKKEEDQIDIPKKRLGRLILTEPMKTCPKREGVGEILDFMIEAHGITKSTFSEKIGCDQSQLQFWLRHNDICFSLEKAEKMAKALEYESTGEFMMYLVDGVELRKKTIAKMILMESN